MPSRPPPPPADPLPNPLPPPPKPVYVRHHQVLISTAAGVAAAVVVSILAAFLLALHLYRRFSRGRPAPTAPSDLKPLASPLRRFSYSQLRRATASFSPSHKLGQGGFGPVFRGTLPSGQQIAVKVMDSGSLQGEREFQNELALAGKIVAVGSSPDRGWVVAPLGFCCDDRRGEWWWWWNKKKKKKKGNEGYVLLLVYELMHNGSLQDALLDRRCPELLDWGRRFSVAVDIARALQFLHVVCDPPVIHGDIKPSNILLDSQLNAKIADFGLARLKASTPDEDEIVVEIDADKGIGSDLKSPKRRKKELAVPWEGGGTEDDASVVEDATESMTTDCPHGENGIVVAVEGDDGGFARAPEVDEMASPSGVVEVTSNSETGGYDGMSLDSGKDTAASGSRRGGRKKPGSLLSGKDWWWRQDNGGGGNHETGGGVKDYVMEWIKSEIKKERPKSDWIASPTVSNEDCLPRTLGRSDRRKQQRRLEWWASLDEERLKKKEKNRPAREWWREEFCDELTKKQQKKQMIAAKSKRKTEGEQPHWWNKDEDCASTSERKKRKKKNWSRGSQASMDWWVDGLSGEMRTTGTARRGSQDWASGGEIPKSGGTISSTPSMRGTVCYVAPEYGGGGPLSEKCDIYSFGVLLLVLISGRRPLQVTASPMSEFERANLISWARHLAYLGRLLELIDPTLTAVDKNQALLCITVALLCIQRSPVRRPSIKEIVGMLTGQSEPPHLPLEFSPSPPGGFSFKSRKKAR